MAGPGFRARVLSRRATCQPATATAATSTDPVLRDGGVIAGHPVPCLPLRLQPMLHQGKTTRESDGHDFSLLADLPFLPPHAIDGLVEAELALIASSVQPFEFCLTEVGRFPGVLSHVASVTDESACGDTERLKALLPIACKAPEVALMTENARGWRTRTRFSLCGTGP